MQETQPEAEFWKDEEFMLYSFKVAPCKKGFRHNWRRCPFAHEDETARRRDPKLYTYSAVICPHARKKERCPRGDKCPWAHNIFEFWLLPSRFKTQLCNHGSKECCKRHFCFFAHCEEELRKAPDDEALADIPHDLVGSTDSTEAKPDPYQEDGDHWSMTDLFKALDLGNSGSDATSTHPHTDRILAMAEAKGPQLPCHNDVGFSHDPSNIRSPPGLMHQDLQRNCYLEAHEQNSVYSTQAASFLPIADSFGALNDFHHNKTYINETGAMDFGLKNSAICSKDDSDECELPSNGILRSMKICRSGN